MEGKENKAERKLAFAKKLLKAGGQRNTDMACAILLALTQQKRKITIEQSVEAVDLLSSFLDGKKEELDNNIKKMRQGLEGSEGQNIASAAEALHYLAENNGYLSDEQKEELVPVKIMFLKKIEIRTAKEGIFFGQLEAAKQNLAQIREKKEN